MPTMYIRDVSEEVTNELKSRAAEEGMSLSAYVAAQLSTIAARPTNRQVVDRLRQLDRTGGPTTAEIVQSIEDGRK